MSHYSEFIDSLTELVRVVVPVIISYIVYLRTRHNEKRITAIEAACTFPTCGHVCTCPIKPKEGE